MLPLQPLREASWLISRRATINNAAPLPPLLGGFNILPFNEHRRRRYHRIIPTLCSLDRPHLSRHLDNGAAAGMPFYIPLFLLLLLSIAAPGCFMPKWVQNFRTSEEGGCHDGFHFLPLPAGRHLAHKFCLPSASMLASIQQWMGPSPSLQRMSDEKATGPPETHE